VARAGTSQRRQDRRTQFLDAAVRVIAQVGARSMRVEDVAREAGASTPLVYYYFDGRHELLTEAFRHANASMIGAHRNASLEGTGRERVVQYLLLEIESDAETTQTWAFWSELAASAVFDDELRKPINDAYETWGDQVALLIREGQRDDSIDGALDPQVAAEALIALMDGLGSRWILGGVDHETADRVGRQAIERILGAPPAA
jgi:AcrR family transcriptional regulator